MARTRTLGSAWRVLAVAVALSGCGVTSNFRDLSVDASAPFDATAVEDASRVVAQPGQEADAAPGHAPSPRPHADAGMIDDADINPADASADGPEALYGPPQSGPFLDGSCPYDAAFSPDGDTVGGEDDAAADAAGAHVPDIHRPAEQCCPATRDPGAPDLVPGCGPDASSSRTPCFKDSDCNKGTNGRCMIFPNLPGNPSCVSECTYDECFSDVDCPGHVPCDCRAFGYGTNVCRTGSACSVDSDCGPGGFCSPTLSVVDVVTNTYFCHRPGDVCFNDRDCPQDAYGTRCEFDGTTSKWACVDNPPKGHPPL
jgi:hypothetical protein